MHQRTEATEFNGEYPSFVKIEADGPDGVGLEEWEAMDPSALASGTPVQRGYLYDEHEADGYLAGVWDCTAFDDKPGPYPVDEYMLLLEGQVIMEMPDGTSVTIEAGEAFIIPKGLNCQWKMPGYVRKIFLILEKNLNTDASNASLTRVTKPTLDALPAPSSSAVYQVETSFQNADGRMSVKRYDFNGAFSGQIAVNGRRIITVLDGTLTVAGKAFSKNDSFYTSSTGTERWTASADCRLIEASFAG